MSRPSNWPLPPESFRYLVPRSLTRQLAQHSLSCQLFPRAMGYYFAAAGHRMRRDHHDDYLLIYATAGRGEIAAQGAHAHLEAGDLLLIPEGLAHQYAADLEDPWTIYWVHFAGSAADSFIRHTRAVNHPAGFQLLNIGLHTQLIAAFETLLSVRNSVPDLVSHIYSANQLRLILSHIALLRPLETRRARRDIMDLERVHALMQAHVHEKLELETLARSVNLSKYHFVKRYRELTGTTPISRFIQLKIERACHLLDTTDQEIKEVAFALGYDDAYYFSRIFRKHLGISATQYRASRS